jgi:hypothetical protein
VIARTTPPGWRATLFSPWPRPNPVTKPQRRARLTALHRRGAEFIVADCLTRAVVAEITRSRSGGAQQGGCSDG